MVDSSLFVGLFCENQLESNGSFDPVKKVNRTFKGVLEV